MRGAPVPNTADAALVLAFANIGASDLPRVGGKGKNLGELARLEPDSAGAPSRDSHPK